MSEYQYYEFLAIDRPLTSEEMKSLRALSTRAEITPGSFINHYEWGDFKGNPDELMKRYFDAHVYVANWGTAIFMVRLPLEALSKEMARSIVVNDFLHCKVTKTHWLITWRLDESENYESFAVEGGQGWMTRLSPVRDELLSGDFRSLYIGWLAGVAAGMLDDDELEPMSPDGLKNLTAAQKALAEFLEIDEDYLAGAGMDSPSFEDGAPDQKEVDNWLEGLPAPEVKALLNQLLAGRGQQAERALKTRFALWRKVALGTLGTVPLRSVEELREKAERQAQARLEKERQKKEHRELKRRQEHEASLKALAQDFPGAWKAVGRMVEGGTGAAYDDACRFMVSLREAYAVHSTPMQFQTEFDKLVSGNLRRKALLERLVKVGILKRR